MLWSFVRSVVKCGEIFFSSYSPQSHFLQKFTQKPRPGLDIAIVSQWLRLLKLLQMYLGIAIGACAYVAGADLEHSYIQLDSTLFFMFLLPPIVFDAGTPNSWKIE